MKLAGREQCAHQLSHQVVCQASGDVWVISRVRVLITRRRRLRVSTGIFICQVAHTRSKDTCRSPACLTGQQTDIAGRYACRGSFFRNRRSVRHPTNQPNATNSWCFGLWCWTVYPLNASLKLSPAEHPPTHPPSQVYSTENTGQCLPAHPTLSCLAVLLPGKHSPPPPPPPPRPPFCLTP